MRTRREVVGLIASIMLACGGAVVAGNDAPASPLRRDTCSWNDVDWEDMTLEERTAWETLGWTSQMWDSGNPKTQPASSLKEWRELSEKELNAARQLGYKQNTWDHEKCKKH